MSASAGQEMVKHDHIYISVPWLGLVRFAHSAQCFLRVWGVQNVLCSVQCCDVGAKAHSRRRLIDF